MPRASVVVLDYGSGNLRSAERALARAGADVVVTSDGDAAMAADGLVVPGVGAFAACMAGLIVLGQTLDTAELLALAMVSVASAGVTLSNRRGGTPPPLD